ncbi:MAG: hypothetical protein H0T54_09415 [Geodermatophilaceae bacterium]|nr:hypothetical protein [Geodermatophilaceae bacterium]
MIVRLVLGLGATLVVAAFAARRILFLIRLIRAGQPTPGRWNRVGERVWAQVTEVFGQRKLLKWSVPGLAHFFTMWAFFILLSVYLEAYAPESYGKVPVFTADPRNKNIVTMTSEIINRISQAPPVCDP